jgi:alkylation response protein AidB-like acyl-CoA dehydrogenase
MDLSAHSPTGIAFDLGRLQEALPAIEAEAAATDSSGAFPAAGIAALRDLGFLAAPLHGLGTSPEGADALAATLRLLGRANLSLGRLYEGHVNALRLIRTYAHQEQHQHAADDARAGRLFAVWNTDDREAPLRLDGDRLRGRKILCSGAGHVERALVTAREAPDAPSQMLLLPLAPGERADLSSWKAFGMRGSVSGAVDFTKLSAAGRRIGQPGDYERQPDFTAGGWRFAAVQCGGIEALLEGLRTHHIRTGRGGDPHQSARFGQAAMATETARLWVEAAARRAEHGVAYSASYTNLARSAVERAALDALELVHRSIGLSGFMADHPLERVTRDLMTYLRQPAPDAALAAAAAHVLAAPVAAGDVWA